MNKKEGKSELDIILEFMFNKYIDGIHSYFDFVNLVENQTIMTITENGEHLLPQIEESPQSIKGFADSDAILSAVESRTSSAVRIERDENFESSISGIYPVGEGSGYAWGITTSAIDGIKAAEKIIEKYKSLCK